MRKMPVAPFLHFAGIFIKGVIFAGSFPWT